MLRPWRPMNLPMTSTGSCSVARTRPPLIAVVSKSCRPSSTLVEVGGGGGGWYEGKLVLLLAADVAAPGMLESLSCSS